MLSSDTSAIALSAIVTFDSKGNKLGVQNYGEINSARIYTKNRFNLKPDSVVPEFESLKKDPSLALQYLKELGATVDVGGAKDQVAEIDVKAG